MKIQTSKYPPVLYSEENLHYLSNGNILKAYRVNLSEIYTSSDADFEQYQDIWYNAFRKLPVGTIVHLQDWYLKSRFEGSTLLNSAHFIDKENVAHFNNREYMKHYCFLFYTKPRGAALDAVGMKNPFKRPVKLDVIKQETAKIEQFINEVQLSVDYIDSQKIFNVQPVDIENLNYLQHLYFNGMYDDLLTDTDLTEFSGGDRKIGVMSIRNERQFGSSVSTSIPNLNFSDKSFTYHKGMLDSLGLELNCNHITNKIFKIKNNQETKNALHRKQKDMFGARGLSKQMEIDSKKMTQSLDKIFEDDSLQFIDFHFNITFWTEQEEYNYYRDLIKSAFNEVDITAYMPSGANKKNIFLNSFYPYVSNLDNNNIIRNFSLAPASCLFTNVTNYKTYDNGVIFQERVNNIPINLDVLYHSKAKNFGVVAPTGEGKSVTCVHLMFSIIEHYKGVGIIIDLGGSYKNLLRFFPKDEVAYISYEDGQSFEVNNFYLESFEDLNTDKLNELVKFVFIHWGVDNPTPTQITCMRKIIKGYYESIPLEDANFPHFFEFIVQNKLDIYTTFNFSDKDLDIENMILVLSDYFGEGAYSFLYNNVKQSFNLKGKRLVVIELDKAKDDTTLLSILMLMISDVIERNILSDRSTLGVVLLDEFAKLLKIPKLFDVTEYYFQTMRKYEGACGIVLQSPTQLPGGDGKNDPSASIIDNMQTLYVLYNKDGYDSVVDRFKLKQHDKEQLLSVRNKHEGKGLLFSEIGIKRGREFNIYRLELPRKVLTAYSTDGVDYTRVDELYYLHDENIEKALDAFLKEKYNN